MSAEESEVMHCVVAAQDVDRAIPSASIVPPGPGSDGEKLLPVTSSVNPPAVPAYALVGASEKMLGPLLIVTLAVPDWPGSSELMATMLTRLGDGAPEGALNKPLESIDPHEPGEPQPAPESVHTTC